jgi:UDP-N-acetylglucosamine 4,6-dehydratase
MSGTITGRFAEWLSTLERPHKRLLIVSYDAVAMLAALWLAFSIRLGEFYWPRDESILALAIASISLGIVCVSILGLYRVVVRYFEAAAASQVAICAAGAAAAWLAVAYFLRVEGIPRSVSIIYFGLLFMLMFFGRLAASRLLTTRDAAIDARAPGRPGQTGVAIYGVNPAATSIAESIRRNPDYRLHCFIDDNPAMIGRKVAGRRIRPFADLKAQVRSGKVHQVLLAMPEATRTERLGMIARLSDLSVEVTTIPSPDELINGRYTISDVRAINVEDLLKRDVVPPLEQLIESGIEGRNVLVTGAGGSIGSEICRQVVRHGLRRIVLFDHSEFALYRIDKEIREICRSESRPVEVVSVVGSVLNGRLVASVLEQHAVEAVFHAAAYKHVPLLERNEIAGVENNVVGTMVLADACDAAGVARLTMISTDKAVRPTNVMGASKRVAELYIQALARRPGVRTCFGMVRFGNVLDSSGSVVQQFRDQIARGGPITVTHPEITRFFMSIPEATQLVLQANALAKGGEVFVLDMGEPIQIVDLAKMMIALSGMRERTASAPNGDIEIVCVGLRPGEKLHEELFVGDDVADTIHPQIKMAREHCLSLEELEPMLNRLLAGLHAVDGEGVREILQNLLAMDHVPEVRHEIVATG